MDMIPGYELEAKLYESASTVVYRGRRIEDMRPVVLKSMKTQMPGPSEVGRFKNEYEILRALKIEGVTSALNLEEHDHRHIIVFDDFQGVPLRTMISNNGLKLKAFLQLAGKITEILGEIHESDIIHKDINPSNILIDLETQQVKIIDFGISTSLSHEIPSVKSPNLLEGTLAYISPEQTGRMNRLVDYRTDFYSLGATFYHLLLGKLPFESKDALEMIHAHIAKSPRPPHIRKKDVPLPVSDIIMKLLAKNAEDRYQSSRGLLEDLNRCYHQLEFFGKIDRFPLAQKDRSDKLNIFRKLYGREREVELLADDFEKAREGGRRLLLVTGYSGVGKTSLVREVNRSSALTGGFFISGKFDQFQKDMPYRALVRAFQELVRRLLMEPEKKLAEWKKAVLGALGVNASVILEVIPEMEMIVGPQPPAPVLGPTEAQNRFQLLFQNFVRVFCNPGRPLVLFLDDLQWADSASLKLIKLMTTDEGASNLLIIGAYRDNEVQLGDPLHLFFESLQKEGFEFNRLKLAPLTSENIRQWMAEILHSGKDSVIALSDLVLKKTGGNPFFTALFIKSLHSEKLLRFNAQAGEWQWDLPAIQRMDITDNVADLLFSKIARFSGETQEALRVASAIGGQFGLDAIDYVLDKNREQIAKSLTAPIREGVLMPIDEDYFIGDAAPTMFFDEIAGSYRFSHDKIRKVVYSMIESEDRSALHHRIGRFLIENTPQEKQEDKIFRIVNQLNLGIESIDDSREREQLARLNLKAGQKAKISAAFEPALHYFHSGIDALSGEGWEKDYEMSLSLFVEAAEAAYLSGHYDQMERLAEVVFEKARDFLDKVKIYEVKIQALKAQYRFREAIDTAKDVLKLLGVVVPKKATQMHVGLSYLSTRLMIAGKNMAELAETGTMQDPFKLAAMRIMMSVGPALYFADPLLLRFLTVKMVKYSLKYGHAPSSAFSYTVFGMFLCGTAGAIAIGHQFGSLALSIMEKSRISEHRTRTELMLYAFVHHWKAHVRECLGPLEKAHQSGMETGDLEYASFSAFFSSFYSFAAGDRLSDVERRMATNGDSIRRLQHESSIHMHNIYRQTVALLIGDPSSDCRLKGKYYDESRMLPVHLKANDRTTLCNLYFNKLFVRYLFEEYSDAVKNAELAEKYIDAVAGAFGVPLLYFYDSLSRLALDSNSPAANTASNRRTIAKNQKKLEKWAKYAPMNHLHKYLLVEAERNRAKGRNEKADSLYEAAIKNAKQNGFIHEEALAYELAAKCHLASGDREKAAEYYKSARNGFLRWGAMAKVKMIDKTCDEQLPDLLGSARSAPKKLVESSVKTSTYSTFERLDLASVMKASQAISSEIVLERLLTQLMTIVMESAGAQTGALVLESGGDMVVEARVTTDRDQPEVMLSVPLDKCLDIPASVVRYVARTEEYLVLKDAAKEGKFSNDPQILARRCVSVFCGPILHKNRLLGVLYLENNLVPGAFTYNRIEVIKLLTSQIGISLENARLFSNLEESELRYRQLYENIIDMVVLIAPDCRVLMANPSFYETIGIDSNDGDNKEKNFKSWILADDLPVVQASMLDKLAQGQEIKNLHFRLQNKTGQLFDMECNAQCIQKDDIPVGYQMVLRDITERKRLENELVDSIKDVEAARTGTILGLAKLAEYRDEDTGAHLERIREYTRILAEELSRTSKYKEYINQEYIGDIYFSSILHDIGKVGIPDSILLKPAGLSKEEFEVIKRHSVIGGDVLSQVNAKVRGQSFLTIGTQIAYFHHEKWDGSGYPKGLKGEEIPLSARIVSLADVYDALTSKRIYKEAYSHDKALKIIEREAGKHFDPDVVEAFLANQDRFDRIRQEMQEERGTILLDEFLVEFQEGDDDLGP